MAQAGVSDGSRCLFVDDNLGNVQAAKIAKTDGGVGWRSCIYYREADSPGGVAPIKDSKKDIDDYVDDLDILRQKWKEFGIFKQ
jgi:pyrimidine and pyridine-specific 5'-nucleotidase